MKRLIALALVVLLLALVGCTGPGDPYPDDMFTQDIFPGTTNTFQVGSAVLQYNDAYFRQIHLNGVLLTPGIIVEVDPVFTGSPAFGITALNIAGWNALVSSQWVTDANGIEYTTGNIGIGTPSIAASLVDIYSNNSAKSKPVMVVSDNSAGVTSGVIYASTMGAKTGESYGIHIDNYATSGTAGIHKYGLRIASGSVWNGAGATNYALYIENPVGGSIIYSIYSVGGANYLGGGLTLGNTLNMSDNFIDNIKKINLTDPTELTINAGAITITQGFHTVDTEGDAATDDLVTINGGVVGDKLVISGASNTREVRVLRTGNIKFNPQHVIESFSFTSPVGSSGTYYVAGYYYSPVTDANLTQASTTQTWGTANAPYGAYAFLVAAAAGTTDVGTVSVVVSGVSITDEGVKNDADSEVLVANITTMSANAYYQTIKKWLGTVTYTLTPAGGTTTFAADFNYGLAAYDSLDKRLSKITEIEVMGRAGASDTGFDIQLLHHAMTGWTYSAATFVPGNGATCSLLTDYGANNDLVSGERFKYEREVTVNFDGTNREGFLVRVVTTSNKAVEFMNISIYAEAIPNDLHLQNTNQSIEFIYNGTNWMEN